MKSNINVDLANPEEFNNIQELKISKMPLTPQGRKSASRFPNEQQQNNQGINKELDNQIFESKYYEEIREMIRPKTSQDQSQKLNEMPQFSSREEIENANVSLFL